MSKLAVSIPEAARQLSISRSHAYRMAAAGQLPTFTIGTRRLVSRKTLIELTERRDESR